MADESLENNLLKQADELDANGHSEAAGRLRGIVKCAADGKSLLDFAGDLAEGVLNDPTDNERTLATIGTLGILKG